MGMVNNHMPKWPPLLWLSVLLIHGSELLIKHRRVVKCSWEDSFGCILEKLGQPEATITKIEISANEKFADPVHAVLAGQVSGNGSKRSSCKIRCTCL